jgi:hypothetical protein
MKPMSTTSLDSFHARQTLRVGDKEYTAYLFGSGTFLGSGSLGD